MLVFKNDSARLKEELKTLLKKNLGLYELAIDLSEYTKKKFNKDIVITMIFRTELEQAEIYKNDPRWIKKPFTSPHQLWHSIDIRSLTFTDAEIKDIEKYLNDKYAARNKYAWTAKNHKVSGQQFHFHLQLVY